MPITDLNPERLRPDDPAGDAANIAAVTADESAPPFADNANYSIYGPGDRDGGGEAVVAAPAEVFEGEAATTTDDSRNIEEAEATGEVAAAPEAADLAASHIVEHEVTRNGNAAGEAEPATESTADSPAEQPDDDQPTEEADRNADPGTQANETRDTTGNENDADAEGNGGGTNDSGDETGEAADDEPSDALDGEEGPAGLDVLRELARITDRENSMALTVIGDGRIANEVAQLNAEDPIEPSQWVIPPDLIIGAESIDEFAVSVTDPEGITSSAMVALETSVLDDVIGQAVCDRLAQAGRLINPRGTPKASVAISTYLPAEGGQVPVDIGPYVALDIYQTTHDQASLVTEARISYEHTSDAAARRALLLLKQMGMRHQDLEKITRPLGSDYRYFDFTFLVNTAKLKEFYAFLQTHVPAHEQA